MSSSSSSLKRPAQDSDNKISNNKRQFVEDDLEEGEIADHVDKQPAKEQASIDLRKLIGIESFGSTKNTLVEDNARTAARGGRAPKQTRKARQYMNRKKPIRKPEDNTDNVQTLT